MTRIKEILQDLFGSLIITMAVYLLIWVIVLEPTNWNALRTWEWWAGYAVGVLALFIMLQHHQYQMRKRHTPPNRPDL